MRTGLGIFVAALVHFMLGAFWFKVFHGEWLAAVGKTPEQLQVSVNPAVAFPIAFVCNLVIAYCLWIALGWSQTFTVKDGALLGLGAGTGIAAMALLIELVFEGRPFTGSLVICGYPIVGLALMGAILGGAAKGR